MNVTIRKARETDRRFFDWQPYRSDWYTHKPWVVTVDGVVYVVLEVHGRENVVTVAYQNGSEAVPNLVRMFKRYLESIPTLHEDARDRREAATDKRLRETMDWMRRAGRA